MNKTLMADTAAAQQSSFLQSVGEYIEQLAKDFFDYLPTLFVDILICVLIWFLARFLIARITKYTAGVLKGAKTPKTQEARRAKSIATLARSTLRYLIYFVAIMAMLSVLGVGDATALLASAGIGGIAIGFGAQNLVKDVIAGLFMVFENQYAVGDFVKLSTEGGDVEGIVEAIAMRVTYIRNLLGQLFIVPNGAIQLVVNSTRGDWMAVVDIPVAYEEDTRRLCDIAREAAIKKAKEMPEHALDEPSVMGISAFNESTLNIRIACRAAPTKQWQLEREIRLAVKEAFDEHGIRIPYPKVALVDEHQSPDRFKAAENETQS
ncbi:MAG: mechanosensitive ion channel family protein [Christensenellales bacterium]|jgi:small-conductance mechanosensitive channel